MNQNEKILTGFNKISSKITTKFFNLFKFSKMTTKFLTCSESEK